MNIPSQTFECYLYEQTKTKAIQKKCIINENFMIIQNDESDFLTLNFSSMNIKYEWNFKNPKLYELLVITENNSYLYTESNQVMQNIKTLLDGKVFYGNFQQNYKVLQTIKKTRQGEIIKCLQRHTKNELIAKFFHLNQCNNEEQIKLIQNELRICQYLSKFNHESILILKEVYKDQEKIILIFDFCEGGTLFSYLACQNFCPSSREIRKIMKRLLQAVELMHKNNIMHRDIKMDNILLHEHNHANSVQLIDFGFATFINEKPYIVERCGTPGYIAPEIFTKQQYNELVDIYSIGQIFFILLTGKKIQFDNQISKAMDSLHKKQIKIVKETTNDDKTTDLFKKMINPPESRYSATKCLAHEYFDSQSKIKSRILLSFPLLKTPFQSKENSENQNSNQKINILSSHQTIEK